MASFRRQHDRNKGAKLSSYYLKFTILVAVLIIIAALLGKDFLPSIESPASSNSSASHNHRPYVPSQAWLPYAAYGEVLVDSFFSLAYAENHEQAIWVAHELKAVQLAQRVAKRNDWFEQDPRITTESAKHSDYTRSGYTRGHLAAAEDFSFSQLAMDQSFLMSNISPQLAAFNGGVWRELEELCRDWARMKGHLFVVSGPVFYEGQPIEKIGKNQISVPHAFYRVVLDTTAQPWQGIGFVIPHAQSENRLENYATSISFVEQITGIDFFMDFIPSDHRAVVEGKFSIAYWPFNEKKYKRRVEVWNKR